VYPQTGRTDRRPRWSRWRTEDASGDAEGSEPSDPFEVQRQRVERPIRRLFAEYGRRHAGVLAVGQVAGVGARTMELAPPLLLGIAVDTVLLGSRPFGLPLVPTAWLPTTPLGQFGLLAGCIGLSFGFAAVFHWIRGLGLNLFAQRVQHEIRVDAYDHIQRLGMNFFDDHQTGELMSVLAGDTSNLEQFLNGGMEGITRLTVLVGGITLAMVSLNAQLALVSLIPMPVIGYYTYRYVRTVEPRYGASRSRLADLYARLENNLNGINVIKTSRTERFERTRVDDASARYVETNWGALSVAITRLPMLRVFAGIGFVATFLVGGVWIFAGPPPGFTGELTVGAFVTFILLSQQLVQPMADLGGLIDQYQKAKVSAARTFGIMDELPEPGPDSTDPDDPDDPTDPDDPAPITGEIRYDDVGFAYGDRPILRDVTATIDPGATVAFVGPSGSGKSTAMKLLPRLYEPEEGTVRLDGVPLADISLDRLRRSIGYVGQEPYLFDGTIRENIAYGMPDATDEAVREAARRANVHEFVETFPEGYETEVGQRGGRLSDGQRQRISIARTILKDPPVLLLDEATSAVDTETELVIQRSIAELAADRTTVAIAHRLSTIRNADQILTFRGGRIVERGTHEDLLDRAGTYATLWRIQAGDLSDLSGFPTGALDTDGEFETTD
jgi:ATP-binding cassette subfamily B protein